MIEKPKAENCFDVYEEYTKTGDETMVYRAEAMDRYIDALRMEIVEKVVDDFTRWRKCDPVTGFPGEEYFKPHHKMVLVKVKFNYLGEDIEVVKIARWDHNGRCWKFQCSEDPMNDPEYKGVYSVAGWRPIFHCDRCGLCCRKVGKFPFMKEFDRGDGACKHLKDDNTCAIYENRPTVCNVDRLYDERFKDRMSKEEWYRMQYDGCRKLKEEKTNEGRDNG